MANSCSQCGAPIDITASACKYCGEKIVPKNSSRNMHRRNRNNFNDEDDFLNESDEIFKEEDEFLNDSDSMGDDFFDNINHEIIRKAGFNQELFKNGEINDQFLGDFTKEFSNNGINKEVYEETIERNGFKKTKKVVKQSMVYSNESYQDEFETEQQEPIDNSRGYEQSSMIPDQDSSTYGHNFSDEIDPRWPKKNKLVAVLLAIIFGNFGIHKFYLGQWIGILYLIFCFTLIPGIIGFIEGIIYLCTDDFSFQTKYKVRLSR